MIAVDTNVASEQFKPRPEPMVTRWFSRQDEQSLFLPSVVMAEILLGIARLPKGQRRANLQSSVDAMFEDTFGDRVLPFDQAAAIACATLTAQAARSGRTVSFNDAQIAAIVAVHGLAIATRDTGPFIAMGVPVIDPWRSEA